MGPNYRSEAVHKLAPLLASFLFAAGQDLPLCASLVLFLALTAPGSLPTLLALGIPHTGSVRTMKREGLESATELCAAGYTGAGYDFLPTVGN